MFRFFEYLHDMEIEEGLDQVDLAVLSDTGVRNLASKHGVKIGKTESRPSIIQKLRDQKIGKPARPQVAEVGDASTSPPLGENLASLVAAVKSLQETVVNLTRELEAVKKGPPLQSLPVSESFSAPAKEVQGVRALSVTTRRSYASAAQMPRPRPDMEETAHSWSIVQQKRALAASRTREADPSSKGRLTSSRPMKRAVFFVGGIGLQCTVEDVVEHCQENGTTVTSCRVFPSRRNFGTLAARLTVASEDSDKVLTDGFWPDGVSARKWEFDSSA